MILATRILQNGVKKVTPCGSRESIKATIQTLEGADLNLVSEATTSTRNHFSWLRTDIVVVLLGSALIAALAQVAVRIPYTPVPVSGQTLAILLLGATLGIRRGTASTLLYLVEGAIGLPVFAEGKGGFVWLTPAAPSGGYLWGFVLATLVVALILRSGTDFSIGRLLGALFVGEVAIFLIGVPWLAAALNVSGQQAIELGLYPFILGEVVKLLIASALVTTWRRERRNLSGQGSGAGYFRDN